MLVWVVGIAVTFLAVYYIIQSLDDGNDIPSISAEELEREAHFAPDVHRPRGPGFSGNWPLDNNGKPLWLGPEGGHNLKWRRQAPD